MRVLDLGASWIERLLSWLPDEAQGLLWLPVFIIALMVALRYLVRRGIPFVGRLLAGIMRLVVGGAAVPLMLVALIAAAPFRLIGVSPPNAIYNFDDAVISSATGLQALFGKAGSSLGRLATTNIMLIILLGGALTWWWNQSHCPDQPAQSACVRPVSRWGNDLGQLGGDDGGPQPTPEPTTAPPRKPKRG